MCLHEKGNAIADEVLTHKTKREHKNLSELDQYIYRTEVGREGPGKRARVYADKSTTQASMLDRVHEDEL